MALDPTIKSAFVSAVGALADRLLDSEVASLTTELGWLGRKLLPKVTPWAKGALRRALGNALDILAVNADGANAARWLNSALKGLTELLEPAHATLVQARFGEPHA